jgi:hypothetical protein
VRVWSQPPGETASAEQPLAGLYNADGARLVGKLFSGNSAHTGGGLRLSDSDAHLEANTILSNTATGGGGLHLFQSDATLRTNRIEGNDASRGGGVPMSRSVPVVCALCQGLLEHASEVR